MYTMTENKEKEEPLLKENPQRFVLFPIKYNDIWDLYKKSCASIWFVEELDLQQDLIDWPKLDNNEKYFIKNVLAFFAGSDGIVLENLAERFMTEVQIPELRALYGFQIMIENVHCVTGKTKILTDKGYYMIKDLENKKINVWNGKEFSNVDIKYTGNQPIYRVKLTNGMELDCTPGHKWLIRYGNQKHPENCKLKKIETDQLKEGDVLWKYQLPILDIKNNPDEFKNPYIHGFFCGDGSYCNNYPIIYLYDKKMNLLNYFDVGDKYSIEHNKFKFYITKKINKSKYEVPINYTLNTKLRWLEGYVDADGCVSYNTKKDATSIQIVSINKSFLKDVQLLLTTMGILSNLKLFRKACKKLLPKNDGSGEYDFYNCKDCYILYISCKSVNKLIKIGFKPKRLELIYCKRIENQFERTETLKIQNIILISQDEKTYCFNEPKNHTGIFNGILTGQSECYSLLIDTYIKDNKEKDRLLNAIETIPCVAKKAKWALKWVGDKESSFAMRLLAFAIVEGVFFSGSFCSIFWLKNRGLMPGLCFSNELISRDEGMHTDTAVLLYNNYIKNKVDIKIIHKMFKEAVEIETEFITKSIPCNLIGMNSDLMKQYIQYVGDYLLSQLKLEKIWKVSNPFPFMEKISMESKGNFFERRISEYSKTGLGVKKEDMVFSLDDDF